ncbi:hypothetical protein GCM10011359_29950 [Nesterenkonia alkaliphila]|nr:hypothetical protein GCM10011359_29950 [Nesterenkonia alkaliphila]
MAHLNDYEGRPERRPLMYRELESLFDWLDERVDRIARSGRKGALAALRDGTMLKTTYAFGLRRNELAHLDIADLRPNPHMLAWGTYESVHVRYGKATTGSLPRRRTVLAVPEFDWAIEGLKQWVEEALPLYEAGTHPALWLTKRRTRVKVRQIDDFFAQARVDLSLDEHLSLHCLRHSYVTHLIEYGYPGLFVTEQVGHTYASTTAIYTSVSNDFKNKTLQAALPRIYRPRRRSEHHENDSGAVEFAAGDGRPGYVPDQRATAAAGRARHPHDPRVRLPAGDEDSATAEHRSVRRALRRAGLHTG